MFAGFLVFHCPLKTDAIEVLKILADSSHRVSTTYMIGCRGDCLRLGLRSAS